MSKRKSHNHQLPVILSQYAESRGLEYHRYSDYHMRLIYGKRVCLDVWTTGKYWIKETNYMHGIVERGDEKDDLPTMKKKPLWWWLDRLFFAVEIKEEREAK